jgi:hypothetical protein
MIGDFNMANHVLQKKEESAFAGSSFLYEILNAN